MEVLVTIVEKLNLESERPSSFIQTGREEPAGFSFSSLLQEAVIACTSRVYGNLDMIACSLYGTEYSEVNIESVHTRIAEDLSKGNFMPDREIIAFEELYRVATTSKELWNKSCELADFTRSAVIVYLKLCIYRFGDSGAFSNALNTIII